MRLVPTLVLVTLLAGCLQQAAPPTPAAQAKTFPGARIETDQGAFTLILYPDDAPETVAHFRDLVKRGYYDGREFTRVIPGFVVQQTDRTGGATDDSATVALEAGKNSTFSAGALGIARGADPHSGGPEFFVMDFAYSTLYGNYTVFGQVVEGLDVVHKIARVPAFDNPTGNAPIPDGVPAAIFDREAIVPPKITKASLLDVTLDGEKAAQYPLRVAPTVRADNMRYSLEHGADLRAGHATAITWYAWNRTGAAPDLSQASALVEGANVTIALTPDATDARILHGTWTPSAAGAYTVDLMLGATRAAGAEVEVR